MKEGNMNETEAYVNKGNSLFFLICVISKSLPVWGAYAAIYLCSLEATSGLLKEIAKLKLKFNAVHFFVDTWLKSPDHPFPNNYGAL